MLERITLLLRALNRDIFEKETELSLSLLAALAGESVILLGPPGVAKSRVARQLKYAFRKAQSFEYLMSRFSTPDEIFGPVSIQKLKTSDTYERATNGYLPTADVVFLDEIWKAGPAIQNTLLTVINEKIFRNGCRELHLPLKLLVAASNELPAKGEGLEALWDRFVIRIESRPIRQEQHFRQMVLGSAGDSVPDIPDTLRISAEEYAEWSRAIDGIGVKEEVMDIIAALRKGLRALNVDEAAERRNVYVSDRRWKNIVRLLRTSAFLHDRSEVEPCDVLPVYHCLWQEPEECAPIRQLVVRALFQGASDALVEMKKQLADDLRYHRATAGRDYGGEIEQLSDRVGRLERQLGASLFVSADDRAEVTAFLRSFYQELAFTRQDAGGLH